MSGDSFWCCAGCGQPVCRIWGAAAAVRAGAEITVRIRVHGACAKHATQVERLLAVEIGSGDEVLVVSEVQQLRPRQIARWAAAMRSELATAASGHRSAM